MKSNYCHTYMHKECERRRHLHPLCDCRCHGADVAQRIEQPVSTGMVAGSSPAVSTNLEPSLPPPNATQRDLDGWIIDGDRRAEDRGKPWRRTRCVINNEIMITESDNPRTWDEHVCEMCVYQMVSDFYEKQGKQVRKGPAPHNPFEV